MVAVVLDVPTTLGGLARLKKKKITARIAWVNRVLECRIIHLIKVAVLICGICAQKASPNNRSSIGGFVANCRVAVVKQFGVLDPIFLGLALQGMNRSLLTNQVLDVQ